MSNTLADLAGRIARLEAATLPVARPPVAEDLQLPQAPSIAAILRATSDAFEVPLSAILGETREARAVTARQVVMLLARSRAQRSFEMIGRALGRDHSTVHYGCRVIARRLEAEADLARRVAAIETAIAAPTPAPEGDDA